MGSALRRNAPMTKISSKSTFIYKRLFPILWFGFIAVFLAVALFSGAGQSDLLFLFVALGMGVFGFFLFRRLVWDLADEVLDAGDHLLVKRRGTEERIPISNIMNVSVSSYVNPIRVSLRLVKPGKLGSDVAFTPQAPFTLNPFAKNRVAEDLIVRVHRERTRGAP
jgi:hypothetical protein